jgi:regulator of RNase E activity RraA
MPSRDPGFWMWAEACEMLDRADRLHRNLYRPARAAGRRRVWEPPVDIFETERELWIVVALPGVSPDATAVAIENGTLVGDNLAAYIAGVTRTGFVVDGAIRDLEGIFPLDLSAYYRGVHPSAIGNVMLTGINVPIRIGNATVMPGDVVLGDREGIYFIPPQFVKEIVEKADVTHIHDEWTKAKFKTGKYKSSDIYPSPTDPALKQEYEEYLKKRLSQ